MKLETNLAKFEQLWRAMNPEERKKSIQFLVMAYKEQFVKAVSNIWDEYKKEKS